MKRHALTYDPVQDAEAVLAALSQHDAATVAQLQEAACLSLARTRQALLRLEGLRLAVKAARGYWRKRG